jgi:hypothetical protein
LTGKLHASQREAERLRLAIEQVGAVIKMLDPGTNLRKIGPKRRNQTNPWFKRGTLHRAVLDTLRRAAEPLTAVDICHTLLKGKKPEATRKQEIDLQGAIHVILQIRQGKSVERVGAACSVIWTTCLIFSGVNGLTRDGRVASFNSPSIPFAT